MAWTRWTECEHIFFIYFHFSMHLFLGASVFGCVRFEGFVEPCIKALPVVFTFPSLNIMFACPECGKQFATDRACRQHMHSTGHADSYKCTRCSEAFDTKDDLLRHERYVHQVVTCPNLQCRCVIGTLSHLQSTYGN